MLRISRFVRKGVGGKKRKCNTESENMGLRKKDTTWGAFTDDIIIKCKMVAFSTQQ